MVLKGRVVSYRGLASYQDPVTGKQRRRSVSRKTREEAEQALRALLRTLPKAEPVRRRTATPPALPPAADPGSLHAFLLRWLAYKERDIRPSTSRTYVQNLNPVLPLLGQRPLDGLRVLDIEDLVQALHREYGPRGAGRSLHTLRMALRQAVRWQLVPVNVAENVRKPKVARQETLVWTPAQAAKFFEAARGHRLHPLFALALSTGMRKGELLALHWGDVNLEGREITVRHNLVKDAAGRYGIGEPKTEAGHRRILLAGDTVDLLQEHRRREQRGRRAPRPTDLVFTAVSGNHVQGRHLDRTYRALMEEAGVPRIRFHDLRHTAASLLIRRGVPPKVVADQLGHADASFTLKVYTHVYDDQRAAAALPLGDLLGAGSGADPQMADPQMPLPGSAAELEQGLEALRRLHQALGAFLWKVHGPRPLLSCTPSVRPKCGTSCERTSVFGFVEDGYVTALDTSIAPGWQQFPLQCRLEEALHCPVQVVNDAHAAALGEYQALGVTENFLYLTVSTGIGAGIVLPSRTGGPAYSSPAELGYVPARTPRGQQLVEYLSSGSALSRLAQEQGYRDVQQLYEKANTGDTSAENLIRVALAPLAEKMLGLTAPLGIRRVALGGGVGLRPLSLAALTQHVQASLCPVKPVLQHAILGDSAGLAGMASLTPLLSGDA